MTQLSFFEGSLISHLKICLYTHFTIVHIIQAKSVTLYRLAHCIIPRLISHRKKYKLLNVQRDGSKLYYCSKVTFQTNSFT